ncbi:MAG TPA: SCO family protein [Verrucomicrobiae bacterium]
MSDRKVEWIVWGGLFLTILGILTAYIVLPSAMQHPLPDLGAMTDFTLTNQDNNAVTLASLRGSVCIADVIFTRCAGQCITMSTAMKGIQSTLSDSLPVKLVSITTDPSNDTPAVLKKYGARYGAQEGRWQFLTGDKAQLHLATFDGLKLAAVEKTPAQQDDANDLFIHSTKFVLIDKEGRIRGYYDGSSPESVSEIIAAAKNLARQ